MSVDKVITHPIDAVILWVDGNDEEHRAKMLPYIEDKAKINNERFRTRYDQVNEIKYTIDSILKFASFVRNIFIITDNQEPSFLKGNEKYNKVKIVDHIDIFKGYEENLPTFNCRPIETCMHRIPSLAEHFIYFNDDFFLINDTKPEDFFKNGLPILRGRWLKFPEDKFKNKFKKPRVGHKHAQQLGAKLLGFKKYYNFRHTPHPLRKSTFKNYFKAHPEVFLENIKYRFRSPKQFTPQGFAYHLEIKNKTCILQKDLQLLYFRSYKKSLYWYKYKLNVKGKNKLFLGLQSLDRAPQPILDYILDWLKKRTT
ncbi:stealth family protein [Winogradskyella luteola]|uniref:Stealth CR1 domain-containing protein n=1 Tax=Winogradskyella luteola TaxID=2828330 RepID=A0A9X1F9P1_9FLAO|nr:stealth family protein [Winogradskyella luteola]MBV7268520.1 Stealth CR1 domain-containing protein [Winogradskyella luteola]